LNNLIANIKTCSEEQTGRVTYLIAVIRRQHVSAGLVRDGIERFSSPIDS
jgi:hypothetical protein